MAFSVRTLDTSHLSPVATFCIFPSLERLWGAAIASMAVGGLAFGRIAEAEPEAIDGEAG